MTYKIDLDDVKRTDLQIINVEHTVAGGRLLKELKAAAKKGGADVETAVASFRDEVSSTPATLWYDNAILTVPVAAISAAATSSLAASGVIAAGSIFTSLGAELGFAAVAGSATGQIGAAAVVPPLLVGAAATATIAGFMLKPEQITHVVVNDSSKYLEFSPAHNLLNQHGKTTLLPDDDKNVIIRLPPRDKKGNVSAAIFQFQKNELALRGAEGTYELLAHPSKTPGMQERVAVTYYQPLGALRNNNIAVSLLPSLNLEIMHDMAMKKSSSITSNASANGLNVHGAIDAKKGGHDFGIVYLSDD